MAKKINEKQIVKNWTKEQILKFLESLGFEVLDNAQDNVDFQGMTRDTLVIRGVVCQGVTTPIDVQIKLITPSDKVGNSYKMGE